MRLVLDTNVWIAALTTRGHCNELFEHCLREHRLITSGFILEEIERKLTEFKYLPAQARAAVGLVRASTQLVVPTPLAEQVCRDASDDWILATARTGRCRCVVTGDRDLLDLATFENVWIVKPRDFWAFEHRPDTP